MNRRTLLRKQKTRTICKWALLFVLLLSVALPVYLIQKLELLQTHDFYEALTFFTLLGSAVEGVAGLIGWILLCKDCEAGKKLIMGLYLITLAFYGVISIIFLMMLLPPAIPILMKGTIFSLAATSGLVIVLQHFWTRYLY